MVLSRKFFLKKERFREEETIRRCKRNQRKKIEQLWKEGLAGWLRGKIRKEEVFSSSLSFFSPFHPFLFPSCYIYHSFLLSDFLSGIILSVKSCHYKSLFLMFDISPCAAHLKENTGMNAVRISKEHLVISQRFPILTHSAGVQTLTAQMHRHTHKYMHTGNCTQGRRGVFKYGKIYRAF